MGRHGQAPVRPGRLLCAAFCLRDYFKLFKAGFRFCASDVNSGTSNGWALPGDSILTKAFISGSLLHLKFTDVGKTVTAMTAQGTVSGTACAEPHCAMDFRACADWA